MQETSLMAYEKVRANGNKERWNDINGYEGKYKISSFGRVKSIFRKVKYPCGKVKPIKEKILRLSTSNHYPRVVLSKNGKTKTFLVHRLVAKAFLPPIKGKNWINHKDGNKMNNNLENLEWCTPSENEIHKLKVLGKFGSILNLKNISEQRKPLLIGKFYSPGKNIQSVYKELIKGKTIRSDSKKHSCLRQTIYRLRNSFGIPIKSKRIFKSIVEYSIDSDCLLELRNDGRVEIVGRVTDEDGSTRNEYRAL